MRLLQFLYFAYTIDTKQGADMSNSEATAADILSFDFDRGLFSGYEQQRLAIEAGKAALDLVDTVIDSVNVGALGDSRMIRTSTSQFAPLWALPKHARARFSGPNERHPEHGTRIYRPDAVGAFVLDGELAVEGSPLYFLGDKLLKQPDNTIIVINSKEAVAIDVGEEFKIVETPVDRIYGSVTARHRELMQLLDEVRDGQQKTVDNFYY